MHVGCLNHLDLVNACEAKSDSTNELEVEFEDGMECEESPKVGDMIFLPHYQINDKTCCYVSSKVCLVVSDCR